MTDKKKTDGLTEMTNEDDFIKTTNYDKLIELIKFKSINDYKIYSNNQLDQIEVNNEDNQEKKNLDILKFNQQRIKNDNYNDKYNKKNKNKEDQCEVYCQTNEYLQRDITHQEKIDIEKGILKDSDFEYYQKQDKFQKNQFTEIYHEINNYDNSAEKEVEKSEEINEKFTKEKFTQNEDANLLYDQQIKDLFSLKIDSKKNNKISIPTMLTFDLKNCLWNKRNYSFDVSTTLVIRTMVDHIIEFLIKKCDAIEIINKDEIIKQLTTKFNVRINDMEPIELVGSQKKLNIFADKKLNKVNKLNKVQSLKDNEDHKDQNPLEKVGYSCVCRKKFENILFDTNNNMQDQPQNYNDLILNMEIESKHLEIECKVSKKDENDPETTNSKDEQIYETRYQNIEFGYILLDSVIPKNVFTYRQPEIDQLDTHDPFANYLGYRYKIKKENEIEYQFTLRNEYNFAWQFTLFPMLLLQLFQIVICIQGESEDKLANLINVYIAYGAFAIVATSGTIMTKDRNICDYMYFTSLTVSILQQFVIVVQDGNFEWLGEIPSILDDITWKISLIVFLISLMQLQYCQMKFLKRQHAGHKLHEDLLIKDDQKVIDDKKDLKDEEKEKLDKFYKEENKYEGYTGEFKVRKKNSYKFKSILKMLDKIFKVVIVQITKIEEEINQFFFDFDKEQIENLQFNEQKEVYGKVSNRNERDEIEMSEWRYPDQELMENVKLGINDIFKSKDGQSQAQLFAKNKIDFYTMNKYQNTIDQYWLKEYLRKGVIEKVLKLKKYSLRRKSKAKKNDDE